MVQVVFFSLCSLSLSPILSLSLSFSLSPPSLSLYQFLIILISILSKNLFDWKMWLNLDIYIVFVISSINQNVRRGSQPPPLTSLLQGVSFPRPLESKIKHWKFLVWLVILGSNIDFIYKHPLKVILRLELRYKSLFLKLCSFT